MCQSNPSSPLQQQNPLFLVTPRACGNVDLTGPPRGVSAVEADTRGGRVEHFELLAPRLPSSWTEAVFPCRPVFIVFFPSHLLSLPYCVSSASPAQINHCIGPHGAPPPLPAAPPRCRCSLFALFSREIFQPSFLSLITPGVCLMTIRERPKSPPVSGISSSCGLIIRSDRSDRSIHSYKPRPECQKHPL